MGAIKPHTTAVNITGAWDGPKALMDAQNDAMTLLHMHAWVNESEDLEKKSSYLFPHHEAGVDTPANITGINRALVRLSQTDMPVANKQVVEAHLHQHRLDAGLSESMGDSEIAEAVKYIKKADDLKFEEAQMLKNKVQLQEAATIKSKAKAAAKALKSLLADKTIPKNISDSVEATVAALNKNWSDLEADAGAEESLRESANLGEWIEARIHMQFSDIADNLFGDGYMTRDERIAFSSAIGDALNAFNAAVQKNIPQVYSRRPFEGPPDDGTMAMGESAVLDLRESAIALEEKVLRSDGTAKIKIIQPGWGSSGYYAKEVLQRDGSKAFPKGTKMSWNHPTSMEEAERPEGDLNDLASELVSNAQWMDNGPKGPGLYADAKVFEAYQPAVNDLAPHIGVSIHARGKALQGEAEGRQGVIVQEILASPFNRVDYVTMPGAGGEIISLFEAVRVVRADQKTTTEPVLAVEATSNVANSELTTEDDMDLKELQEKVATLETNNQTLTTNNARLSETLALRDAKDMVIKVLEVTKLPEITQNRLVESLAKNPPMKEGALDKEVFTARIQEAIKAEVKYLESVLGTGQVRGLGESGADGEEGDADTQVEESLTESFSALGLSESGAKIAAKGRK